MRLHLDLISTDWLYIRIVTPSVYVKEQGHQLAAK